MKLSLAIGSHNEGEYLRSLLERLVSFLNTTRKATSHEYEVVVVDDYSTEPITLQALQDYSPFISLHHHSLAHDFATHKNYMNSVCTGDYIVNCDADEWLSDDLLFNLPDIIESNPTIQAYWFPRVNTVQGLTDAHVRQWGWQLTTMDGYELPLINWPDEQCRMYKRSPDITWVGKVHETITGYKEYTHLPHDPAYAIQHHKTIARQTAQNDYYTSLMAQRVT
jgi:glycosyltransferase involved in cell wall biosynthesis